MSGFETCSGSRNTTKYPYSSGALDAAQRHYWSVAVPGHQMTCERAGKRKSIWRKRRCERHAPAATSLSHARQPWKAPRARQTTTVWVDSLYGAWGPKKQHWLTGANPLFRSPSLPNHRKHWESGTRTRHPQLELEAPYLTCTSVPTTTALPCPFESCPLLSLLHLLLHFPSPLDSLIPATHRLHKKKDTLTLQPISLHLIHLKPTHSYTSSRSRLLHPPEVPHHLDAALHLTFVIAARHPSLTSNLEPHMQSGEISASSAFSFYSRNNNQSSFTLCDFWSPWSFPLLASLPTLS